MRGQNLLILPVHTTPSRITELPRSEIISRLAGSMIFVTRRRTRYCLSQYRDITGRDFEPAFLPRRSNVATISSA